MRIRDWSADVCSSDQLDQKQSGEVEGWRERWAEMQNRALELANVPDRVDHRSHQRQGTEQEPTGHMGPSAPAMERPAGPLASREGLAYDAGTREGERRVGTECAIQWKARWGPSL